MNKHGYHQNKLVPGLWTHTWRPVQFALAVDNFGVKYVSKEHTLHLKIDLEENYTLTTKWEGRRYIVGFGLHAYMPNYMTKAPRQFKHKARGKQHALYPSAPIKYVAKKQYTTQASAAALLDKKGKHFTQQVCGNLLFLGCAVNSTLLCPVSAIASQYSVPTEDTMKKTLQSLDYAAT